MLGLLASPAQRAELGARFHDRVQRAYSAEAVIHRICTLYEGALTVRDYGARAPRREVRTPLSAFVALCLGRRAK